MQLRNFILIGSFAALAASGAAMAQTSGSAGAGASGSTSSAPANPADRMPTDLGKPLDKAKDKAKRGTSGTTATPNPNGTNGAGPISVTPPSQDNPNTAVDVNTDPAKAHAAAGTNGVNANADLNATSPNKPTPNKGKLLKKNDNSGSGQ